MVQDIDTEENYYIAVDVDSGYFPILAEEEAQEIIASFSPDRKQRCKVIPVGKLNEYPTFAAMIMKLKN